MFATCLRLTTVSHRGNARDTSQPYAGHDSKMTERPRVMCSQVYMDSINDLLWEGGSGEGVGRPKLEVRIGAFGSHLPGLIEKQVPGHASFMQSSLTPGATGCNVYEGTHCDTYHPIGLT